ncbi:hypothetical protein L873DRAFT_1822551 [Choiromyces venosus 120613-1]|uniref:Uncharacterized protein n=1 Tax=Choiromyces venosus 120613-1 TaxID=1336337 RepID=A0A3N4J6R9_9PEZI|nr:hypothetical protein L873DRAFT_1822551 [Choiromyces venosus 120613-1]
MGTVVTYPDTALLNTRKLIRSFNAITVQYTTHVPYLSPTILSQSSFQTTGWLAQQGKP